MHKNHTNQQTGEKIHLLSADEGMLSIGGVKRAVCLSVCLSLVWQRMQDVVGFLTTTLLQIYQRIFQCLSVCLSHACHTDRRMTPVQAA